MFSESNMEELREQGYTVVPGVLQAEEADKYRGMFEEWVAHFEGVWPPTTKSLIKKFRVGHMEPAWATRLKAKKVFAKLWGTEKLLTSFDGIAIGRPPESGDEDFYTEDQQWLHTDHTIDRIGLHGYQGAVYLEDCDHDDWTFEVIEGSHKYLDIYYEECEYAVRKRKENPNWRVRTYSHEEIAWFKDTFNLDRKRVPCPKGGMILWDTRLIHASTQPLIGRKNAGRWRYVLFMCMAPAVWADDASLKKKREAYDKMLMTTHWPCNGISFFKDRAPGLREMSIRLISELPPSAKTTEAQQLAGVLPYEPSPEDEEFIRNKPLFKKYEPTGGLKIEETS